MGPFTGLTNSLLAVVVLVAVVYVGLRVARSIFGTSTTSSAATEVAAKLVAYPTGSDAVLRRRFVRALTAQCVVMPSGERLAFADLVVRVAPEDLERLDPDGDLDRLGEDGARLYLAHAERSGWQLPRVVTVTVEVDPGLRSGWIPPARGSGRSEAVVRPLGWDAVGGGRGFEARAGALAPQPPSERLAPQPPTERRAPQPPSGAATERFGAVDDHAPTMNVAAGLRLERDGRTVGVHGDGAVLGRHPDSPMAFEEPEVSFRHAAIRRNGTGWQVKDLGSTNGTTVDGLRVDDWTTVRGGSMIRLAGVTVTVQLDTAGTVALHSVTSH